MITLDEEIANLTNAGECSWRSEDEKEEKLRLLKWLKSYRAMKEEMPKLFELLKDAKESLRSASFNCGSSRYDEEKAFGCMLEADSIEEFVAKHYSWIDK